ncbi:F-box protein skip23 [Rhynchospora pubera]|uniref:F-box protein skip23 n=1 Tax=Rhynchospora pubera TaxID=906938 RepID=A0AAV8GLJ1_9POAL|nr:F-box protein skip23 [Rhynchospora pubera]
MEAKKAEERDWSSLVPELLNLIARYLTEISDFVRFRAVCTAWRFSTPITSRSPQFPWIVDKRDYPYEPHMLFYSITSSKTYTIHAPKFFGRRLFGTSQGYMLTDFWNRDTSQRFHQLSLLNPLNNHEIPLLASDFCLNANWVGPQQYHIGEYVVCLAYAGGGYHKSVGQDKRRELESDDNGFFLCFHMKGMFFKVEGYTGVTKVTDLTTGNLAYVVPPFEDYKVGADYYPVEALGDILVVFQHFDSSDDSSDDWFNVHRLDLSGSSSPRWVKVNNIGNQALFIERGSGFALEANDFSGVKANCIYLTSTYGLVKRIDIETGEQELFDCPFEVPRWFVPNLEQLQAQ